MSKGTKGFTITEFLFGLAVLALVMGLVIPNFGCFGPNFVKAKHKSREAQVKSNIHTIQIALERYAVDTGGIYPLILYGGDEWDTFATYRSSTPPYELSYSGYRGDVDVLLEFGYLSMYPVNPFMRSGKPDKYSPIVTNPGLNGFEQLEIKPGRVNTWARPRDRGTEYIRRNVGGYSGNLMWDVSEGQRHPPWPIIVVPDPEPDPATGYVNPDPGQEFRDAKRFDDDFQFWLTPGNFYYYALFDGLGGYSSFVDTDGDGIGNIEYPIQGHVVGFKLAGYGYQWNPGLDVYNLYGDYTDRSLFTINNPETDSNLLPIDIYAGPDDRRDGVIIVVEGGTHAWQDRTNQYSRR